MAENPHRSLRRTARGRAAALSIALAAHVAILAGLILGVQTEVDRGGPPVTEAVLTPPWPGLTARPAADRRPSTSRRLVHGEPTRPISAAQIPAASPEIPGAASAKSSAASDLARLGAALRSSGVGCDLTGARLSPSEREACHERLGAGAADVAYITAVPPQKRAYYSALQASEAKMAHDPLGGHAPGFICGKDAQTKGFKLGSLPCAFTPSPSPWAPELDVRPP